MDAESQRGGDPLLSHRRLAGRGCLPSPPAPAQSAAARQTARRLVVPPLHWHCALQEADSLCFYGWEKPRFRAVRERAQTTQLINLKTEMNALTHPLNK